MRVTHNEQCVLWTGHIAKDGYGRVNRDSRNRSPQLAHRWAWEMLRGPIPDGYEIHHICGKRACVNTGHLQLVTRSEHRALERSARTHCKRGHPYAIFGRNHNGRASIYCTECKRITDRAKAARSRDAA